MSCTCIWTCIDYHPFMHAMATTTAPVSIYHRRPHPYKYVGLASAMLDVGTQYSCSQY
jgi:hypothetical protein